MKIIQLEATNIKRLKAVQINPVGNVIQVSGPNGSGKSSVLDSIYYALAGTSTVPSKPVRKGEEKALIKLNLGEVTVIRRFTQEGATSLVIEAANGARFPSPQAMLDGLLGQLTFDPLAFSRADTRKQLEVLRSVVKLEVNLDELEAANQADFSVRAGIQRTIKQLEGEASLGAPYPDSTPDEEVDVNPLLAEMEQVGQRNVEIEKVRGKKAEVETTARDRRQLAHAAQDRARELRIEIDDLNKKCLMLKVQAQQADELVEKNQHDALELDTSASTIEVPLPLDVAEIKNRINQAQLTNKQVQIKKRKRELEGKISKARNEALALTAKMKERLDQKQAAIASAPMPVPGLSFGEGEVLLNGLPLNQASSAENLQVSIGIAMALNPKLRVLRIQDGSLLDDKSMKLLQDMAETQDFQIWVERVDLSGKVGIVMEDGAVRVTEAEKVTA